ncbi:MAG: hypothetical protein EOM53_00035 [Alphaproteobacteria bacterium]|nr:hypothetical protein [Alphaproteobacteria bacterium]
MNYTFRTFMGLSLLLLAGCSGVKAGRISASEGDTRASAITDKWIKQDSVNAAKEIISQLETHRGFRRYLNKLKRQPVLYIREVSNETEDAYFPIEELNNALLKEISRTGDFILLDRASSKKLEEELAYQHGGATKRKTAKKVGQFENVDAMIFGEITMQKIQEGGETVKQYTVNIRLTNLETGVEIARMDFETQKYLERGAFKW